MGDSELSHEGDMVIVALDKADAESTALSDGDTESVLDAVGAPEFDGDAVTERDARGEREFSAERDVLGVASGLDDDVFVKAALRDGAADRETVAVCVGVTDMPAARVLVTDGVFVPVDAPDTVTDDETTAETVALFVGETTLDFDTVDVPE